VEPLVEEGLLGVHLLQVAVGVAMHLNAVGGWRNALVRPIDVLLRLGEDWRACLAVLPHGIVEGEAIGVLRQAMAAHAVLRLLPAWRAIVVMLGYLRGVVVERGGNIGERRGSALAVFAVAVAELGEVEVDVVEVDKLLELLGGRVHGIERVVSPRLAVHCALGETLAEKEGETVESYRGTSGQILSRRGGGARD